MTVIDKLLDSAYQDTQLIIDNDQKGDNFVLFRDVDFVFYSETLKSAEILVGFINDNQYGNAQLEKVENKYRIIVSISMPTTQNIICSISGFMVCLAELFSIEYDGWGCVLQLENSRTPTP